MTTVLEFPASFSEDLQQFQQEADRFRNGAISAAEFRSFRVPRGVYEQRESQTYMLRTRCPAGIVLPHQLRALAQVSRCYGNGVLHVSTRQDIQVHRVLLEQLYPALAELYAAGLSTRGGGGNTVRNMTGCYDAGVCPAEAFDISPYVVALTEALLPDPLSYQLPRKYKIAFSGCPHDCAGATVHDLGFMAKRRNGAEGFAVYVGGGMGASSRVGTLFEPFVPADEVYLVAEAVKRVFDQHGNRKNRQKARLRFLVEQLGLERFRQLYAQELAALRASQPPPLTLRPVGNGVPTSRDPATPSPPPRAGFDLWRARNVFPQRQEGHFLVQVPLALGDIDAATLEQLAEVIEQHGESALRATQWQNFVLRWVAERELTALHTKLVPLGLAEAQPPVLRNLVACTGAATCSLGICLSRGLSKAIQQALTASELDLDGLGDLRIHISGCPNSCGRHPVADLGFFGVARRVQGRLVPHYTCQVGGRVGESDTRLAQGKHAIPAKNVPDFVVALLQTFQRSAQYPRFDAFLDAEGRRWLDTLAVQYQAVPDFEGSRAHYIDWDATELFSLAGRGPGECGAGVFDLIEVDLQSAREAVRQQRSLDAVVLAARSLLVTRGQQASDESGVLQLFAKYFVDEGLVDASAGNLIARSREALAAPCPADVFSAGPGEAAQFVDTIEKLYASMDASLRFKPADPGAPAPAGEPAPPPPAERSADFRGVVCPLNYVKTKLLLGQMRSGEVLSVLLDEPGTRNVPDSVRKDGHQVLAVEEHGDHWKVVIRCCARVSRPRT